MSFYRRRLPHWQPEGAYIFLTWRLYGSMPAHVGLLTNGKPLTEGRRFVAMDRLQDRASTGPTWLKDPRVAACVAETFFACEKKLELYDLFAWVIMANHVHLLINPHRELRVITRAIKNISARAANQILQRTGSAFWQDESFDLG